MNTKATSLRLPTNMADELAAIARADDDPMSEVMRKALEQYIVSRRSDPQFKERVRERLEKDDEIRALMERMAGSD
jgi:predicted DNA-binding protein